MTKGQSRMLNMTVFGPLSAFALSRPRAAIQAWSLVLSDENCLCRHLSSKA